MWKHEGKLEKKKPGFGQLVFGNFGEGSLKRGVGKTSGMNRCQGTKRHTKNGSHLEFES